MSKPLCYVSFATYTIALVIALLDIAPSYCTVFNNNDCRDEDRTLHLPQASHLTASSEQPPEGPCQASRTVQRARRRTLCVALLPGNPLGGTVQYSEGGCNSAVCRGLVEGGRRESGKVTNFNCPRRLYFPPERVRARTRSARATKRSRGGPASLPVSAYARSIRQHLTNKNDDHTSE